LKAPHNLDPLPASRTDSREDLILHELQQSISRLGQEILNVGELFHAITEEACRIFGVSKSAVLILRPGLNAFDLKAKSGFFGDFPADESNLITICQELASDPKVSVQDNPDGDRVLLIPITQRGVLSGLLYLSGAGHEFQLSPERLQIAGIFGNLVSIAIENADMFDRISNSQREWENTFDSIADPIYIVDSDYMLRKTNKSLAAYAMKSIKLPVGQFCYSYLFDRSAICPWCPVPKGMQSGQAVVVEAAVFSDGIWQIQSFPYTDKSGKRTGSINVLRDITLLKRMQEQLIESEKMASTGKLISGVAHEVRNPLFGISTTARALANELKNKEEIQPYLDIITSETARLNRLMEDLLNYARPVKIDKNPSDIAEIVKEVIDHYQHAPEGPEVTVNLFTTDPIPPINVDRTKINQVLMNLVENGIQHSVGSARVDIFLQYLSLSNPPEIHIVIKDYGKGIKPDVLQRIFDPFFTTRQRGTGLGLSIVRKVIHDHGGRIAVESHQDMGTTFRISLPAVLTQQ
jgi:signal transduction histidine kinase